MSRFKVDKLEVPVLLTHTDGSTMGGAIFLAPYSPLHQGRQTMRELMAEKAAFLPLRNDRGDFLLVGKEGIACLKASLAAEEKLEFVRRVPVRARLQGGVVVEGELIVPEGDAAFRVSDYLNSEDNWLRIEHEETVCWVNRGAILELRV